MFVEKKREIKIQIEHVSLAVHGLKLQISMCGNITPVGSIEITIRNVRNTSCSLKEKRLTAKRLLCFAFRIGSQFGQV